jgi:transcriptional regulator of NAD metabolism
MTAVILIDGGVQPPPEFGPDTACLHLKAGETREQVLVALESAGHKSIRVFFLTEIMRTGSQPTNSAKTCQTP